MEFMKAYLVKSPVWIPPVWLDLIIFRFHLALANEFLAQSLGVQWTGPEPLGKGFEPFGGIVLKRLVSLRPSFQRRWVL